MEMDEGQISNSNISVKSCATWKFLSNNASQPPLSLRGPIMKRHYANASIRCPKELSGTIVPDGETPCRTEIKLYFEVSLFVLSHGPLRGFQDSLFQVHRELKIPGMLINLNFSTKNRKQENVSSCLHRFVTDVIRRGAGLLVAFWESLFQNGPLFIPPRFKRQLQFASFHKTLLPHKMFLKDCHKLYYI